MYEKKAFYKKYGKRILDVIFAYLLLLFLYVPMVIIALGVCLTSKGGALFRQKRVGKNGRIFTIYKFRTMYKDAPELSHKEFSGCEHYITPLGKLLRRTSLDELPQLFNVLSGDMSLVGVRPLIVGEMEMHIERISQGVYAERPGMTGLAQTEGRDSLGDKEKLFYDKEYVSNISFSLDTKILLRTVFAQKDSVSKKEYRT